MGKKRIGLIVAALWAVTGLSAQNYQCAVGVRGGVTATGLSVRYHFDPVIVSLSSFVPSWNK